MIIKSFFTGLCIFVTGVVIAQTVTRSEKIDPEKYKIISTDRPDGRYVSTRGLVQYMLRNAKPELAFNPNFTPEEFKKWQNLVRARMQELMHFPVVPPQPPPKLLSKVKREGYTVEKWEIYPLPGGVVPFLMLVPDGVSAKKPAPAVLCFPGTTRTKENLAGEEELSPRFVVERHSEKNHMALFYVRQGIVAVAVENPGIGETGDLEKYGGPKYDVGTFSRYLLDLGWSYLGLSSFQGQQILNWMKTHDFIDNKRIALSGHSLGTEPAMVLAVLNPDICAVVFNDYMCRLIKRATVLTKPADTGLRPVHNGLFHFPPDMWKWFDHPDIVASFAPRPVIITEGGAASDLDMIKKAYQIMGAKDNITIYHYPKYYDPISRRDYVEIPEGLTLEEYYEYANVDAPNHYFKANLAVPWLTNILMK